ncbi:MAG: hypothetical protein GY754_04995 [bacterium]|nr:hypothetical protein [bacterium]
MKFFIVLKLSLAAIAIITLFTNVLYAQTLPSMGFEVEIEVDAYNYHYGTSRFVSVEEKTPDSLIFRTEGDSPEFEKYGLFSVTVDNGSSISKRFFEAFAISANKNIPAAFSTQHDYKLKYGSGIIEIATGPLPYDRVLHHNVRAAVRLFIETVYDVCTLRNGYSGEGAMLSFYNERLPDLIKGNKFISSKEDMSSWYNLLKLKAMNKKGHFFCFKHRSNGKKGQATFGIPLEKILHVPAHIFGSFNLQENIHSSSLLLNCNSEEIAMDKALQKKIDSMMYLWGVTAVCAQSTSASNYPKCKKDNFEGCNLTCNKNWFSPTPHVDICELYQVMKQHRPEITILEQEATKVRLQLLLDKYGSNKEFDYKPTGSKFSTLLSPFNPDLTLCKKHWGEGFYNVDATRIPVLELLTRDGLKTGVAIEDRKGPFSETNCILESPMEKENKQAIDYFNYWFEISESRISKCKIEKEERKKSDEPFPREVEVLKCR